MNCSFCHGHSRAPKRMSREELEIVMDANGKGFTVFFFEEVSGVKITVRANDSSQKEAVITLNKRLTDIDIGQDFDN